MSILDQLLGGSDSENANQDSSMNDFGVDAGPAFGFAASDILHSASTDDDGDSSEFTGIGGIAFGFESPISVSSSSSSDSASYSNTDGDSGGLLGGLL